MANIEPTTNVKADGNHNSKKSVKKKRRIGKHVPKPGEAGFKTATQLRNARKRRSKQKKQGDNKSIKAVVDPSSLYLSDPKSAPVVKKAQVYFRELAQDFEIHVGPTEGWRTVSKLAVRPNEDGELSIGLFAPNSHDLIPVPDCVAHHPSINAAVAVLERLCRNLSVKAFDESMGKGHLRHVAVNVERATGKCQLTLVWNSQPFLDEDETDDSKLLNTLTKAIMNAGGGSRKRRRGRKGNDEEQPQESTPELQLHSLWVHFNASWKHANAIFAIDGGQESWKHIFGPKYIEESLELGTSVCLQFPPNVFRQANIDAFTNIIQTIRSKITATYPDSKPSCVELYGGVGTIGLNVANLMSSLISSDENPFNKECFMAASKSTGLNVSYKSKNATAMVRSNMLEKGQIIIVDPPRKGLDEDVLTALCQAKMPEALIYVSCGFEAFERDCKALLQSSWKLEHAEGHLLFPGSDAIETLGFFTKA